jgi:hypothetical protein
MKILLRQSEKKHDANRVHDALIQAGLIPDSVMHDDMQTEIIFNEEIDAQAVQAVIDAYRWTEPAAPPDLPAMMREIEAIDTSVDLDGATTIAQLKAAIKTKFQRVDLKQQKIVAFQKARAGLK